MTVRTKMICADATWPITIRRDHREAAHLMIERRN